jgi:hypothetical protein
MHSAADPSQLSIGFGLFLRLVEDADHEAQGIGDAPRRSQHTWRAHYRRDRDQHTLNILERVANMARGAPADRAASAAGILRDMRGHLSRTQLSFADVLVHHVLGEEREQASTAGNPS